MRAKRDERGLPSTIDWQKLRAQITAEKVDPQGRVFKGSRHRLSYSMDLVLDKMGRRQAIRDGYVGNATRSQRGQVLRRLIIDVLHNQLQFHISNVLDIRAKHSLALSRHIIEHPKWQRKTKVSYLSHLSCLLQLIGYSHQRDQVQSLREEFREQLRCQTSTRVDKSLEATGVLLSDVIESVHAQCPYTAASLLLMDVFGLRAQEALMLRPACDYDEDGRLHVTRGTKGGRPRTLEPKDPKVEAAAIAYACTFVPDVNTSMIPGKLKLKQGKSRFYRVIGKAGFKKSQIGATPHSLRHQFAVDFTEKHTGERTKLRGGEGCKDPILERQVRQELAERLGHNRQHASSAYVGSPASQLPRPSKASRAAGPAVSGLPEVVQDWIHDADDRTRDRVERERTERKDADSASMHAGAKKDESAE